VGDRGAVADLLVPVFGKSAWQKILIARFIVQTGKTPAEPPLRADLKCLCTNYVQEVTGGN
jgi:hypothetical protein